MSSVFTCTYASQSPGLLISLSLMSSMIFTFHFLYAHEFLRNLASLLMPLSDPRRTSILQALSVPRRCWCQKCILHSNSVWLWVCSVAEHWHCSGLLSTNCQ